MTPILAYYLKINMGIAIFYAFYRLFFFKDTFFHWRRYALLSFFIISLIYPLMNFQEWIKEQEPIQEFVTVYSTAILPEVSTSPNNESTVWMPIMKEVVSSIYLLVVTLLIARFIIQISSVCILAIRSKKSSLYHTTVRILTKPSAPFSFFKWIFIHPSLHNDKELKEILAHESTHANQWHSIDVIISEIITISCWINPFAWLLKKELRNNLEYIADNRVILSGYDTKSYQYHLLELTHQQAAANLYNSFNVLPIKNRITMMNRKRTKSIGKTKYTLFIPLAGLLLLFSNIEIVARNTKCIAQTVIKSLQKETPPDDKPYTAVEQMPTYPGGDKALIKYISKTLIYPAKAIEDKVEGKVYVRFVISQTGNVEKTIVIRSLSKECDDEAIRVVKTFPQWIPGKQNGNVVPVLYVVPITFKLKRSISKKASNTTSSSPLLVCDKLPEYPGGQAELLKYIGMNLKYPAEAHKMGVQGTVIVRLTISETGEVTNPTIIRSLSSECDDEAVRVLKDLPKWSPGKNKGENVPVYYTIPISFKLQ